MTNNTVNLSYSEQDEMPSKHKRYFQGRENTMEMIENSFPNLPQARKSQTEGLARSNDTYRIIALDASILDEEDLRFNAFGLLSMNTKVEEIWFIPSEKQPV